MRIVFALITIFLMFSCSLMQRSQQSGYSGGKSSNPTGIREDENSLEHQRVAYELGLNPAEALSEDQLQAIDDRRRVRILERRLETVREKEQYSKVLPWLESDKERITFLSIPTIEGRQMWTQQQGIWQRSQAPSPALRQMVDEGDIAVGMPVDFVRKAWGEPQDRQISGNPIYKNEKWKYTRYIASGDGYKKETRYVYFEAGKVVGWETE